VRRLVAGKNICREAQEDQRKGGKAKRERGIHAGYRLRSLMNEILSHEGAIGENSQIVKGERTKTWEKNHVNGKRGDGSRKRRPGKTLVSDRGMRKRSGNLPFPEEKKARENRDVKKVRCGEELGKQKVKAFLELI